MIIDSLVVRLGYDLHGEADLHRFKSGLESAERRAHSFVGAFARLGALATGAFATIGGARALGGFVQGINQAGAQVENLGLALEALEGSSEGAQKAANFIVDFADATGRGIEQVEELYRRSKAFGLDPQSGDLQKVVDSASKYAADLDGVLLAIGQASAKQRLQGEEVLQLVERGIPVWEMLTRATGKSAAELQKMQQRGLLGMDYVRLLIDEMGRDAEGFSKKQADTYDGMLKRIGNSWTKFRRLIAESGYFDAVKERLEGIRDTLIRWERDGTLQAIAERVSNALVGIINFAEQSGRALYRLGGRLGEVGGSVWGLLRAVTSLAGGIVGLSPDWSAALGITGLAAATARGRAILGFFARLLFSRTGFFGALLLLFDDIKTELTGGQSWLGQFPVMKERIQQLGAAIDNYKGSIGRLKGAWSDFSIGTFGGEIDFSGIREKILENTSGLTRWVIEDMTTNLAEFVNNPLSKAVDVFIGGPLGRIEKALNGTRKFVDWISGGLDRFVEATQPIDGSEPLPPGVPAVRVLERDKTVDGEADRRDLFRPGEPLRVIPDPKPDLSRVLERIDSAFAMLSNATGDQRLGQAVANAAGNSARMSSDMAATQMITNDNRVDARDQSVNPTITVNQVLNSIEQLAPAAARAAAGATGRAIALASGAEAKARIEEGAVTP